MSKKLRIPIARLGAWHHPQYGTVKFEQDDFASLINNFTTNARGYEPPLRYGHHEKGPGIHDGERALAHMIDMYQHSDVLWGVFEPNNESVVEEVERGEYRYATAEIIRKAKDKVTGKPLGPFLKSHALTNTPFIPNLPRNVVEDSDSLAQVLSDEGDVEYVLSDLTEYTPQMMNCTNCGCDLEQYSSTGLCAECVTAVEAALEPRANPELTIMQKLLQKFDTMMSRLESLPWEILGRLEANESAHAELYSDAAQGEQKPAETPELPAENPDTSTESEGEEQPAPDTTAPEALAEEDQTPDSEDDQEGDTEPDADPAPDNNEENINMEELEKLQAEKAELEAIRAQLMAEKAEIEAAKKAAEDELAAVKAAEEARALEAAAAQAAEAEKQFAILLSDRVTAAVNLGVAPARAEKAASLVKALKNSTETVLLSEGADPIDVTEAVFELLSDAQGEVDFEQAGWAQPSADDENPWKSQIEAIRNKRAGK